MSAEKLAAVPIVAGLLVAEEVVKAARVRAYHLADELAKRPPRGFGHRSKRAALEGELAVEEHAVAVWLQVDEWHAAPGGVPQPMGDQDWLSVEYDRLAAGADSGWSDDAPDGPPPAGEPVGAGWSGDSSGTAGGGGWQ